MRLSARISLWRARARPRGLMALMTLCLSALLFPARAQDSDPFVTFKSALEGAVRDRGGDPERQTYHFVVLFNTARTSGPKPKLMLDLYNGLLHRFLVAAPEAADRVSFAPFQMDVREEYAAWNQPFAPVSVSRLSNLVPATPESRPGSVGGHDIERALLFAAGKAGPPESAVFIVLSDNPNSDSPKPASRFRLTYQTPGWDRPLRQEGIVQAARGSVIGVEKEHEDRPVIAEVYYRIYLHERPQPLGTLTGKTRTVLVGEQERARESRRAAGGRTRPAVPDIGSGQAAAGTIGAPPGGGPREKREGAPVWPWALLGVLVVGGVAGYVFWLYQPRPVQVSLADVTVSGTAQYGRRAYIGGEGCQIALPGFKPKERVASLEVTPTRALVLRGEGLYRLGTREGRLVVTSGSRPVTIKHHQGAEYQLTVKPTR